MDKAVARRTRWNSGQGLVEFALVIPILLIVVYAIIEGGRLLFIYSSIAAAGREAARYAAGIGNVGSNTALYDDCNGILAAATRIGTFAGVKPSDITIAYDKGPGTTSHVYCTPTTGTLEDNNIINGNPMPPGIGYRIDITVKTKYNPIVPVLPISSLTLQSQNSHTLLIEVPVIAYTPYYIPGGQTCNNSGYTISESPDPATGPTETVTVGYPSSSIHITNILVVWDTTGNSTLSSVGPISGTALCNAANGGSSVGPYCSTDVDWTIPGISNPFNISLTRTLKNPVIIRITYVQSDGTTCTFGK